MSQSPSTPTNAAHLRAMAASSPLGPSPSLSLSKRTHFAMANDDEPEGQPAIQPLVNQNIVSAARRHAESKRLRTEQVSAVEDFIKASAFFLFIIILTVHIKEPISLRDAKIYAAILAMGNKINDIVVAQPAYEVSDDLKKNLQEYAAAFLLSSKTINYKGDEATNLLLAIVKSRGFDIPAGIENIPADYAKLTSATQYALTQERSSLKKLIGASVGIKKDNTFAPNKEHSNIFQLAQAVVKGTQCTVNVVLCTRLALMRAVFIKYPDCKFWNKFNKRLAKVRADAGGDPKKLAKGFRYYLEEDQKTHGPTAPKLIDRPVDAFQQEVDDLITAKTLDTATTPVLVEDDD
ncbi:hypothetical protein B0H14DRAFT_3576126 [Mycena olivaceomarginata]|nr:hypothetical protein B0H14DRAFT_3576126 [Mycena olivaceomarginata]